MAVAFDAVAAENNGTGATLDVSLTPGVAIRGLGVIVTSSITTSDIITGVAINPAGANLAMSRVRLETATGVEDGAIYGYFYQGSNIPAGALTIRVSKSDGTTAIHAVAQGFTATGPLEIVDHDGISTPTNVANPSVTLSYGGRTCAALGGIWHAGNSISDAVVLATMTDVHTHDFGNDAALVSRQTTPGTADFAFGYTMIMQPSALLAFAVSEVVPTQVDPGTGVVTATGFAPTIQTPRTVNPGLGEVLATGFAPTVAISTTISTGLGEMLVTGYAPTIEVGAAEEFDVYAWFPGDRIITGKRYEEYHQEEEQPQEEPAWVAPARQPLSPYTPSPKAKPPQVQPRFTPEVMAQWQQLGMKLQSRVRNQRTPTTMDVVAVQAKCRQTRAQIAQRYSQLVAMVRSKRA